MAKSSFRIAIVGVAVYASMTASTVYAAKGVKKTTTTNGQHVVTGVVTAMTPDGTGGGTFQVRTANQHKKNVVANANGAAANANGNGFFGNQNPNQNANGAQNATQNTNTNGTTKLNTFNVTAATQFHHQSGAVLNGAALHVGARVRVTAMGNHAQNVQIHLATHSRGNFTRHRASSYHPHIPHQRRIR